MQAKKIFRNIIIAILSITIYNIYAINNTYADDTITITLPSSSVNLPITPTSSGVFNSTDINVQVTTSNTAGYTLSMTAADVNLTRTAAVNGSTPTIPTITTSYAESNFPTGYWGYKMSGDTNYSKVLSTQRIVDTDTSTANTAMSNVITFAAKLDNSKPAGSYTTTLTFLATAYPSAVEMQNITKTELAALMPNVGDSIQMVDNRDGNKYWVTHEADGKFWMTQNLDLCIGCTGTVALTSENTNLTTSGSGIYADSGYTSSGGVITWTPDATAVTSGRTISGTTVSGWTSDNNEPYSAEGGDTYYYTSGTTDNDTGTLATCLSANGNDEEYCKHWHVGNYYNWSAAIASNDSSSFYAGTSDRYKNAENSICPSGWTLPYGRDSGNTATYREFGQLFLSAGITTSRTATSYATDGFLNIRTSPLFFVRGGGVTGTSLRDAASYGYYWSSSVYSASYAYDMVFSSSGLTSADNYGGCGYGFSVRCLVR